MHCHTVTDDENVWRDAYYSDQQKAFDRPKSVRTINRAVKSLFGTGKQPLREVSANLYDQVDLAAATIASDTRAKEATRDANARVKGWVKMRAGDLKAAKMPVHRCPIKGNPHHANISFLSFDNWEDGRLYLQAILSIAEWQDPFSGTS